MKGFDIIGKLGEGAYSIVYKVRRREDKKVYALKKVKMQGLNEKEKNNSLNEVRILASIKSPFVISYKEAFFSEEDKCLNLVMEYADKGDLFQRITTLKKRRQSFEEADVWRIFIQLTRGLKSLHDLKILHRDFKSANIFLFSDGTAKIGDLNVSKVVYKGLGHTQTGTPYYASPEVWNNEPYDTKSDIWSLACITYEMLTLNPPFRAESFDGLYKKVIAGKYTRISGVYSNDMNELLKLLFKVNPKERPSCGEILRHPLVQKRIEFFKAQIGIDSVNIDAMDDNELLKTIRLPKNLIGLTEKLPKPSYNSRETNNNINTFPNNNLPNINCSKTNTNNTNSFKINKDSYNQSRNLPKDIRNKTDKIYNLFGKPGTIGTKYEGRKEYIILNNISNQKKISSRADRRILETYKLYVSNDAKKILSKSKYLPKISQPKANKKSPK